MRKLVSTILIAAFLTTLFLTQAVFGFTTQGVVTGRFYDELANSNNSVYQDLYDMGLGWVRIEFEEFYGLGGLTYTSPEIQANKVKFQNVINNAHAKGLKVLGVVGFNSMPYNADFPNTDASILDYKYCVQWHLDNYSVDAVEIWNEPGGYAGFTIDNFARYAKTLIEVYALKTSYPNVKFVGPATANAEIGAWLGNQSTGYHPENSIFNCTDMLNYRAAHNGNLPLDVISWHAYGTGGDPDGDFYFGRTFNTYYNEILAYTDRTGRNVIGNYPIWFTEYGWNSNNVGLENQRIYLERIINEIYAKSQVEIPFLYNYRDDGNVPGGEGNACGIRTSLETGSTPKRAYYPFVAHSCLVGLFTPNGYNEWTINQFIDEFYAMGGRASFGSAYRTPNAPWYGDKAHYWGPNDNGAIQSFNYGAYGECGILMKWDIGIAYTVKGAIYSYYVANGGPYAFGWPLSREYWSNNAVWQDFENGRLKWTSSNGVTWIPN